MLIGYARVSTDGPDQTTDLQRDHLAPLGWEHIILTGDVNWKLDLSENTVGYLSLKNPYAGPLSA